MAAVLPITNSIYAPSSNSLVLPPSTNSLTSQTASTSADSLVLPPSSSTQTTNTTATTDPLALQPSNATTQTAGTTPTAATALPASNPTAATALATTPSLSQTAQPLDVVFNALATAGVDAAVNNALLAPPAESTTGTFSVFLNELFSALAAQSAAQQTAQANAQSTATDQATSQTTAATAATSPASAFVTNANSTTPNSTLEIDVQNLAQSVNGQTGVSIAVTANANAASTSSTSLTPLQQSFDQFLTDAGGSPGSASLGGFLQSLATNLHTVQSPLGNIVNTQT